MTSENKINLTTDTTLETKIIATTPSIALSILSDNLTIEVTSSEENVSTEIFRETTLNPSSNEESEEQITVGEDFEDLFTTFPDDLSEENGSGEEETTEGMTTEYPETVEPFNVNLTTSQLGNKTINSLLSNFINA